MASYDRKIIATAKAGREDLRELIAAHPLDQEKLKACKSLNQLNNLIDETYGEGAAKIILKIGEIYDPFTGDPSKVREEEQVAWKKRWIEAGTQIINGKNSRTDGAYNAQYVAYAVETGKVKMNEGFSSADTDALKAKIAKFDNGSGDPAKAFTDKNLKDNGFSTDEVALLKVIAGMAVGGTNGHDLYNPKASLTRNDLNMAYNVLQSPNDPKYQWIHAVMGEYALTQNKPVGHIFGATQATLTGNDFMVNARDSTTAAPAASPIAATAPTSRIETAPA